MVKLRGAAKSGPAFYIKRLVAFAYLGSPPRNHTEVLNVDFDPQNNRVDNLRYASDAEVNAAMTAAGRAPRRGRGGRSALRETQVIEILKSDEPRRVLAQRFKIGVKAVSEIKNGKTWRELWARHS